MTVQRLETGIEELSPTVDRLRSPPPLPGPDPSNRGKTPGSDRVPPALARWDAVRRRVADWGGHLELRASVNDASDWLKDTREELLSLDAVNYYCEYTTTMRSEGFLEERNNLLAVSLQLTIENENELKF